MKEREQPKISCWLSIHNIITLLMNKYFIQFYIYGISYLGMITEFEFRSLFLFHGYKF